MTLKNQNNQNLFPALLHFPSLLEDFEGKLPNLFEQATSSILPRSGLSLAEDDKNIYVEAQVPGLKKEDIELSLDKGILWIRGEKKEEEKDKKRKFYRKAETSFSYRIALPNSYDESKEPEAELQNGTMKITFKKTNKNPGKKIRIK